jgi:hypothetical protein
MTIDKASFFLALGAIAAGGAGGYFVRDRNLLAAPRGEGIGATAPQAADHAAAPAATTTGPPCEDGIGVPATCPPPPFSADESGCAPFATRRCEDYKQTMKPRVAEQAVACILALSPAQRCDSGRVNRCGHEALMNACSAPEGPATASAGAAAGADDVGARCEAIARGCPGTSMRECRATLAGMTELGRARTAACMSAHCADKGLLGCEAPGEPK